MTTTTASMKVDPEKYTLYQFFRDIRARIAKPENHATYQRALNAANQAVPILSEDATRFCVFGAGLHVYARRNGLEEQQIKYKLEMQVADVMGEFLNPVIDANPDIYAQRLGNRDKYRYVDVNNTLPHATTIGMLDAVIGKLEGSSELVKDAIDRH